MKKLPRVLLAALVTAAAGFAAASIVTGKSLADVVTGTTATTTTATTTTSTTTTTGVGARRMTICHITGSKKHPAVTITVSQSAVPAHLRHGDHLGACDGSEKPRPKHQNQSSNSTNHTNSTTTTNPGHNGSNGSGHGNGK
jgi:hypothetical protein